MLEAVLSKCIAHYLKEYLKPLEPGQMELKVFQGTLQLFNLQLLPTALVIHQIPFIIRKGSIKYLKAIFPWKNIKNAACEVLIEDMFIVLRFESEIILKSDIGADQKTIRTKGETNAPTKEEQSKFVQGLFESVIDNLRVLIKNIHIRIEFPCDPLPIIIGLSTPEISINTVDEKDKIITTIQHPHFLRKLLLIKEFSIYFDTNQNPIEIKDDTNFQTSAQAVQDFSASMRQIMKEDHQYLFNPTTFKTILIHTRDKTQSITNRIETTIDEILLNLDLLQCRSIIQLNCIWSQFMKRRKYVNCMRPNSFNMTFETWQYAHKCAIVKIQPYVFKPYLALTILKARLKYIDLFKQAKVSKLSASLLGSPKQKLESLEKKVGKSATLYLREMAEAVYLKEESMKDSSDVTAFDLSELKNIFESTELVFSMHQFSTSIQINSFNLELLYFKGSPLIALNCQKLNADLTSLHDAVKINVSVKDSSVVSYINDVSRKIFKTIQSSDEEKSSFISLNFVIPTTGDVSSIDCTISPIKVTLDTETMNNILDFFMIQNKNKVDQNENKVKTVRLDIGEQLQGFKILRNYKMSIKMDQMSYDFPFKSDNSSVKFLTFELGNLTFTKQLHELLPKSSPEIPMDFKVAFNLNVKIDTFTLMTSEDIKARINLILINGKFGVNIFANIDLPTLQVFIAEQSYSIISYAVKNILAIPFMHSGVISNSTQQVLMAGRSKMACDVKLKALNIFLNDNFPENEMKITIGDLLATVQYYVCSFQGTLILKNLRIDQFGRTFVEILDKIDCRLDKRTDIDPLRIDAEVNKPHLFMNFDTINWIMAFSNQILDFLPKKNEIEETDLQIKMTKSSDLPNIIISDSILMQSFDSFIERAGTFDEYNPPLRSRANSINSDSSCDEFNDSEIKSFQDESNSTRLNLNVSNVLMEMIDEEEGENSTFKIESVSISDPTAAGFVLSLNSFSISRAGRFVLKPVNIEVPVYLPDPIKVVIDYAESELFPGDINAMNVYSPQIFKLMFGGPSPLIKDKVEVIAFAKSGTGFLMKKNKEIIAKATVSEVSLYIKITSKALTVDVKVPNSEGVYLTDNRPFLNTGEEFHCTYIGTMNDQDILVEVPYSEIFLRNSIVNWIVGFIPENQDDTELQPLKIKLDIESGKIGFLSSEITEKLKENDDEFLSISLGKTNCSVLRDKGIDLEFDVAGVDVDTKLFEHPIFSLKPTHFIMNKTLMKSAIPSIEINVPIEHLPKFIKEITAFVPTDLMTSNSKPFSSSNSNSNLSSDSYSLNSLDLGIDFVLNKFSVSLYPNAKTSLRLEIPEIKFVHNSSYNITGIDIGSILLYTVYLKEKPTVVVNLSKIQSILTFSEVTDFDLSKITFDSIAKLPQKKSEKQPLKSIFFSYKMNLIQINYTHFFAQTLIDTIFNTMFNFQSFSNESFPEIDNLLQIDIHVDCIIEKIQFNFVIIDPIASVTFTQIKLKYKEKCEASVQDLTVLPISIGEEKDISKRSLITKKNLKEDLLSITIQNGELYAVLAECDFYIDLKLLLYLAKFLFASPFLKIKPLMSEMKKSSSADSITRRKGKVSFSKALPFALIFKLKKVDVSVPISLENDNIHELQIHISSLLNANSSSLSINMNSLSLNFYETKNRTVFPSILSDFAVHLTFEIEEDSSFSIKANILDIYSAFSAADIFNFAQLGLSITKALNSFIFTVEESKFDPFKMRFSNIEIISDEMTFVLCKDNRSSSQIVPIFRSVIPPILFKVAKTTAEQQKPQPVEIDIQPYFEFFNELTGNFDLIIEPFNLRLCAKLTEEQATLGIHVLSNININLPLTAILKMKSLVEEIKDSLKNQKTIAYSQLPSMWLCNKLGSFVSFTIGKDQISLGNDRYVPLFGVSLTTPISFSVDNLEYSIEPNSFNYPTYLSRTILAVKEPYKGGLMISFERTFQVENNLNFELKMYSYDSENKKYSFVSSIEPHGRQPLLFEDEIFVLFTKKGSPSNLKYTPVKLTLMDKLTSIFPIMIGDNKSVQCVKTVYNDTKKAARVVSISSQYLLTNLLPSTLYIKSDNNEILSIQRGETIDFYNIENDTFIAYLSLSDKIFLKRASNAKIDYKNPSSISLFNPEVKMREKCMINFLFEKDISQTKITLYMPLVLYNMTMYVLDFEDTRKGTDNTSNVQNINVISSSNNINNENNNFSRSLEILPNSQRYWCPSSIIDHTSEGSCMITAFARGNSKERSQPFDCFSTGHNTLLLPSLDNKDLYVPLRYNSSNNNFTSILTFSPLITLINDLDTDFVLTPIRDIPSEIPSESKMALIGGMTSICDKYGSPLLFPAHSEIMIPYIPKNGTFAITVEGYSTSPSLSLLEQQKTVFKVQNQKNYILIELKVIDIGTGIRAEFKNITFPTPILINNQLDVIVMAFQLVCLTPFEIQPHTTSIFAFDEPFVYPSVTISFGTENVHKISLVEDTEKVEMRKNFNGRPVYVQVRHNKNGNRMVIISQEEDEQKEKYKFVFESSIYGIAASLIDLQTRELALCYLSNLRTKLTFNSEYLAVSLKLKSMQIDDQNPLAPNPTVVYGYYTDTKPYLSLDFLCPIDTSLFTSFDYFAINLQRIDVDADCSFVSDWINLSTSLNFKTIHPIRPTMPSKSHSQKVGNSDENDSDGLIALRWFEIAATYVVLSYRRKTTRPPMIGKVPSFMRFIPGIKAGRILLPGVVISRLTDRLQSIASKLTGDYKTAAFKEIIQMLGSGGKILTGLGVTSAIASSLDISLTSDMTSNVSLNSIIKTPESPIEFGDFGQNILTFSEYENRIDSEDDELASCISYDALLSLLTKVTSNDIQPSPLIQFILPKFSVINEKNLLLRNEILSCQNASDFERKKKMVKKKMSQLQKEKNQAIILAGLKLKSIPGFGYGRGIAGVLTQKLNDPLKNIDPMENCSRVRETRPFAGAKITKFNPALARAQKIIFKNGGLTEKVKEICPSKNGEILNYVLMTENTLYIFKNDLSEIVESVKFCEVKRVHLEKSNNNVVLKLKNGKSVTLAIDSKICVNFLLSLLRMNNRFGESLLL